MFDLFSSDEANSFEANVEPYYRMPYEELVSQRYAEPLYLSKIESQFGVIWPLIANQGVKGFAAFVIVEGKIYGWDANTLMAFFLAGQVYQQGIKAGPQEAWAAARSLLAASGVVVRQEDNQPIGENKESEKIMTSATLERPAVAAIITDSQPAPAPEPASSKANYYLVRYPGQEYPGQLLARFLSGETLDFPEFSITLDRLDEGPHGYGFVTFLQDRAPDIVISDALLPAERNKAIDTALEVVDALKGFEPVESFFISLVCGQPGRGITKLFVTYDATGMVRTGPEIFDLKTASALLAAMHPQPAPAYHESVPTADQPPS